MNTVSEKYKINTKLITKLFDKSNKDACKNLIESILNDIDETKNLKYTPKTADFISIQKITKSNIQKYQNIRNNIFKLNYVCDGQECELFFVYQSTKYLKFWNSMSFFSYDLYKKHKNINDSKKRLLVYLITDDIFGKHNNRNEFTQVNPFHTVSYFNDKNSVKDDTFEVHYLYSVNALSDTNLQNWVNALIS